MNPDLSAKKALFINLKNKTSEVKSYPDLKPYIGGVGVGLKLLSLYKQEDPLIFSVGPLNGYFPYVSKTSVVLSNGVLVEDLYLGGALSFRIRFSGIDSIVITQRAEQETILDITNEDVTFHTNETDVGTLGLPGKRSFITNTENNAILDGYFYPQEDFLNKKLREKNIGSIVFTGSKTYEINQVSKYQQLFTELLERENSLTVAKGMNPSCSGCPIGCNKSRVGELGGNVLVHSLVACQYAEKIYSDVGIVFSCLNMLGYDYTHEQIESLPSLIENTLKELS